MHWKKSVCLVTLVSLVAMVMAGCTKSGEFVPSASKQAIRPEGWAEETHSNNVDPDYETVFPQDKVNQIKITITPEDWNAMQANMVELLGNDPPKGGVAPDKAQVPRAPGQQGRINMRRENPMWVSATIEFNGLIWTNVGVRYKGNSSLRSGWKSDTRKLPLKLDFDEFESEHLEIENQRFYGFKQLSLSNAYKDYTYMRDVITADLLAEAGLVAAEIAYYEVIMDYGDGPVNFGLYVVIEVIDDTVIDRFFADNSGNIYEGDGPGVSLAWGTFNQIEGSFLKENNRVEADWSDIEALYDILHSTKLKRISDPEAWREIIESRFDVDVFLEWLAISAIIQHWDAYGSMSHNFYLYHDPDTGLLTWISWDHNEVLGVFGGGSDMVARTAKASLGRDEVGQNWPLIRYLLDDPVYHSRYIDYIEEIIKGVFRPNKLERKYRALADLIAPYVAKEFSEATFESAVQELIDRIYERYQVAITFLVTRR